MSKQKPNKRSTAGSDSAHRAATPRRKAGSSAQASSAANPSAEQLADTGAGDDAVIGRALRGSLLAALAIFALVGGWFGVKYLTREQEETKVVEIEAPQVRQSAGVSLPKIPLLDITADAGIDFTHYSGAVGEKLLPETMGSGVAWIDYDNDGDQDLLLINSCDWPWSREGDAVADEHLCRLYANDGSGQFSDVTAQVGLNQSFYAMGVAVGDYDNDGWTDLFLSAVGHNRLLKNETGVFRDLTEQAGVAGAEQDWSTSCGFFDYDNDGLLDLIVCNYVDWSRDKDLSQSFSIDGENRAYGPPRAFGGTFSSLYHNDGEGKFSDVSEAAGLHVRNRDTSVPLGKAMGVAPVDVDGDGYLDLVIANDTVRNFLLLNQRDGTFRESAELAGIAYDRNGNARGAMGIDAVAYRDDGTVAIGIGNFANEPSALYLASGPNMAEFNDLAMATGLGPQTRLGLTFGLCFLDVDLDGGIDMLGVNGHLEAEINKVQTSQFYAQPPQLFWNAGAAGGNQLVPLGDAETGMGFSQPLVGRGAAFADIDNDGDLDLVLTANGGPPRLLRNDQRLGHHWLRFKLIGQQSNRSAIGARVEVRAGDSRWNRVVMPTRGYLSQSELPLTFGLGERQVVDGVTIYWPNGMRQEVEVDGVDQTIVVTEQAST